MALRMQKKLLGMTIKSKGAVKNFVDENTGLLLDNLYDLALLELDDTKMAKKVLKDLIKLIVKLGLLYTKNQLNDKELAAGDKMRKKFRMVVLTMLSYHEVAFSFDQSFLENVFEECRDIMLSMIQRHLTEKSQDRCTNVFGFYGGGELLDNLYNNERYTEIRGKIMANLTVMVEQTQLAVRS